MLIFDTVVAECTAPFKSSLSVIRLAGKESFSILSNMVNYQIDKLVPRQMYYASIYEDKNDKKTLLDKGMFVIFKDKESFCGEDTVEFYLHGSRIIVSQVIQACLKYGARQARGGEFSAKAYYNGKLDLTEAEAVNQIVNARTQRSKDFALKSLSGVNSTYLLDMKKDLNLMNAEIEVNIDYPEFDEDDNLVSKTSSLLPKLIKKAKLLASSSRQSLYLFNGVKIAIIGEPNVGKSTLLNKILGQNKAIVSNIPGTTRDVVEGEVDHHGIIYKFFDTAGIRKEADVIEQLGIEKSYEICAQADLILVLSDKKDAKDEITILGLEKEVADKPIIYVSTKKDLYGVNALSDLSISQNDNDVEELFNLIDKKLDITLSEEAGFTSQREIDIMDKFVELLVSIQEDISLQMTIDVIEIKLIEASKLLDSLLGVESTLDDIYQTVFKHFCIGK